MAKAGKNIFEDGVQGVRNYSINLLWLNSGRNPRQQYIHPASTPEELDNKLLLPAIKWAEANPEAEVNIWYDSSLYQGRNAVRNTEGRLSELAGIRRCNNVNFKDIRSIGFVNDNRRIFESDMPLYFRIDFLKMIISLHKLKEEGKDASVYSDLEVGDLRSGGNRMDKAELFDADTMRKLRDYGVVVNESGYAIENQFVQMVNDDNAIKALRYNINACLSRVVDILNLDDFRRESNMSRIYEIPFRHTVFYTAETYRGKLEIKADFVGEKSESGWIPYDPDVHGYQLFTGRSNTGESVVRGFRYSGSEIIRDVSVRAGKEHNEKQIPKVTKQITAKFWLKEDEPQNEAVIAEVIEKADDCIQQLSESLSKENSTSQNKNVRNHRIFGSKAGCTIS